MNLNNFLSLNSAYSRLSFTYLNNFSYSSGSLIGASAAITLSFNLINSIFNSIFSNRVSVSFAVVGVHDPAGELGWTKCIEHVKCLIAQWRVFTLNLCRRPLRIKKLNFLNSHRRTFGIQLEQTILCSKKVSFINHITSLQPNGEADSFSKVLYSICLQKLETHTQKLKSPQPCSSIGNLEIHFHF